MEGQSQGVEPHELTAFCPVFHRAIEIVGRRWTGVIIRALLAGCMRFSEITAAVPGLSDRMLSERLKELEEEGIVVRTVHPETPVRILYNLTPMGEALVPVFETVSAWAETWLAADSTKGDEDAPRGGTTAPPRDALLGVAASAPRAS